MLAQINALLATATDDPRPITRHELALITTGNYPQPRSYAMTILDLHKDSPHGWTLYDRKTKRPIQSQRCHSTKRIAMSRVAYYCRLTATKQNPISLVIRRIDGTIEEERTYPRAADPKRSKG